MIIRRDLREKANDLLNCKKAVQDAFTEVASAQELLTQARKNLEAVTAELQKERGDKQILHILCRGHLLIVKPDGIDFDNYIAYSDYELQLIPPPSQSVPSVKSVVKKSLPRST